LSKVRLPGCKLENDTDVLGVGLGAYSCFASPSGDELGHAAPVATVSTSAADSAYAPRVEPDQPPISIGPQHATGDEIFDLPRMHGRGRLSLINGTGEDAVALMFSTRTGDLARSTYIRAGETATIKNVATGRYWVRVTQGQQWDDSSQSFLKFASFFIYPTTASFAETQDDTHYFYDDLTLTLHAVPNGNIQTKPISKEEFWRRAPID
jgi:hypothetical protein